LFTITNKKNSKVNPKLGVAAISPTPCQHSGPYRCGYRETCPPPSIGHAYSCALNWTQAWVSCHSQLPQTLAGSSPLHPQPEQHDGVDSSHDGTAQGQSALLACKPQQSRLSTTWGGKRIFYKINKILLFMIVLQLVLSSLCLLQPIL